MSSFGKKLSKHSKYSCVHPGPPFNSNTFIVGLLPICFVHTLNFPFGVSIAIIFTPPVWMVFLESSKQKNKFSCSFLFDLYQQDFNKIKTAINPTISKILFFIY